MQHPGAGLLFLSLTLAPSLALALPTQSPQEITAATRAIVSDPELSAAVSQRVSDDPQLAGAKLDVAAERGIVRIRGEVPNADAAIYLIELAESVDGVQGVTVNLTTPD